jgi:hypothetical protein
MMGRRMSLSIRLGLLHQPLPNGVTFELSYRIRRDPARCPGIHAPEFLS